MLIEDISVSQILTAILFIAALIAVQIYISKNKNTLKGKWASNQRIRLTDSTRLGPTEKVQIIQVDESEFLYFFSKGNQPVIVPINTKEKLSSNLTDGSKTKTSAKTEALLKGNQTTKRREITKVSGSDRKIIQAISLARKQNPKVSFD